MTQGLIGRHVEEERNQGDPLLKFRFGCTLPPVEKFSSIDVLMVSHRVVSISPLLEIAIEHENAPKANSHWYFMADDDVSALTFTFTEYVDLKSLKYMRAWTSMMINKDGTYNAPKYYKRDITVMLYEPDFSTVALTVKILRASPSRISATEVSYDGSDPVNIEVEFTYDSIKFK